MTDFTYQLIALLPLPNDGFTSFTGFLRYNNLSLDLILKFVYMGDDTNQPVSFRQRNQQMQGLISGFITQGTKALINKHGFNTDSSCCILDQIRKPQCHG